MAWKTFCYKKNGGSIKGCAMDGNLNALRVNLSVSNAQKVVVIIYFEVSYIIQSLLIEGLR